jgi:predicted secreted protein
MRGRERRRPVPAAHRRDAEFDQLLLRLDLRLGEMAALRLGDVLHLGLAKPSCTAV